MKLDEYVDFEDSSFRTVSLEIGSLSFTTEAPLSSLFRKIIIEVQMTS